LIGTDTRGRAVRQPPKATGVTTWARGGGRRAHDRRPMEEGGAGAGGCASAACHRPMARPCVTPRRHTVPTEPSLRPVVASVHHRRAHLGVRRRGRRGALGTTSRGVLVLAPNHFKVALVDWMFLKNLQLNYTEAWIPNLLVTLPSTTSTKALGCFDQPILHALRWNLRIFSAPRNSESRCWLEFSPLCTSNLECRPTWKWCASTNCTTFPLGEFEVFRWILENAPKVLDGQGRSKA
jgi:hypothetical protein